MFPDARVRDGVELGAGDRVREDDAGEPAAVNVEAVTKVGAAGFIVPTLPGAEKVE